MSEREGFRRVVRARRKSREAALRATAKCRAESEDDRALGAENERLKREVEALEENFAAFRQQSDERLAAVQAVCIRLKAALRPFADWASGQLAFQPDDSPTLGDCRRGAPVGAGGAVLAGSEVEGGMSEQELRELDARVHRAVMGLHCTFDAGGLWDSGPDPDYGDGSEQVPRYSSEIAAAWLVVEELSRRGHGLVLQDWTPVRSAAWAALFDLANGHDTGHILHESAPVAICRAALEAVK